MMDQERGAYTPQTDAPLAFDARRPADRRPLPMTLIASAGVLVAIVAALVLAYRGGVRGSENPRPVGEPVGAIKTAAAPEAPAADDPGKTLDVYAAQNVPAAAPNFAPPPEAPQARPVAATPAPQLQVRTVDPRMRIETPEPTATAAAESPSPSPARPAQVAAAPAPVAKQLQTPVQTTGVTRTTTVKAPAPVAAKPTLVAQASAPAAKPAALKPAAKTVAATTLPAAATTTTASAASAASAKTAAGAMVQIGAFSSRALAEKGFADSAGLVSAGGHGNAVESVQKDGKTFYRATLTGFADRAAAKAFCEKLVAKGGRCLVKG